MKRKAILLLTAIGAALIAASGVALAESVTCDSTPPCYGTLEGDDIMGTASPETIRALEGADDVNAGGDNDTIYGGTGSDDELRGQGGDDTVYGGRGSDSIGADVGDSVGSTDRSFGGGGNDGIFAADGNEDIIDCGKGSLDRTQFDDGIDTIKGCEITQPM